MLVRHLCRLALCAASLIASALADGPATADETVVFDPVTLMPSIVYQDNVAGEQTYTETYYTYITKASTTQAIPIETGTLGYAADGIQTGQIAYTLALAANTTFPEGFEDEETPAMAWCWYPVSGYYGRLARILFYGTMFFSVLAHRHEWLVAGALATGLTYTAVAALQAMVMVWTNQGIANPDGIAILGLVAFSLSMLVPLLNWSSTINKLGAERPEDSVGRSIIVTWGLFLTVGFLSLFAGIWSSVNMDDLSSMRHVMQSPTNFFWLSAAPNITCNPASGVFDMTAGQDSAWQDLYVTSEFVNENNCQNPCSAGVNWPFEEWKTIFRDTNDLILLNKHQINTFVAPIFEAKSDLTTKEQAGLVLANGFLEYGTPFLILVVAQGVWAVMLGRRSPGEVRNLVYWFFTNFLPRRTGKAEAKRRWLHFIAKFAAIFIWAWTTLTSVLAVIFIIFSVYVTEWFMHEIPQSDHIFQVDQWSGMVATAMVLFVAVVFQFQGIFQDVFYRLLNRVLLFVHNVVHRKKKNMCEPAMQEQLSRSDTKRSTNRTILVDSFMNIWHSRQKEVADTKTGAKNWRQDWKDFWDDPRKVVRIHGATGSTQVRSRRVAGEENEQLIEAWNKGAGDDWLDLEEFIAQLRKFDMNNRLGAYKFKPRIIDESESEERTRLNWDLLRDIFKPHNGRYTWSSMTSPYQNMERAETDQTLVPQTTRGRSESMQSADYKQQEEEEGIQLHPMSPPQQTLNPFVVRQYSPLS